MQSFGYLEYDPKSPTTRFDPWWLILKCDIELARLYQYFVLKEASKIVMSYDIFGTGNWPVSLRNIKISKSVWGAHISIIRGEKPLRPEFWKKYQNKKIIFSYESFVQTNGFHFWIPAFSSEFTDIRLELGLSPEPKAPYHFTIGRDTGIKPLENLWVNFNQEL